MDYKKNYYDYINYVKTLDRKLDYSEIHHIIPRCLGGTDDKDNLVVLTAREHFLAHYLLTKIYPDNIKIIEAFLGMMRVNKFQKRYINSRLYESLKIKRKQMISKKIVCLNTGKIFDSTLDCSKELNINRKDIYNCIHKENHVCCKGLYFEEYNPNIDYTKEYCQNQISLKEEKRMTNKIVCLETGEVFQSCYKLASSLGIDSKRRSIQGFLMKYGEFSYDNKNYKLIKKANKKPKYTKIICIETGEKFNTVKEASEKMGINKTSISRNALGKIKSAGGYHWRKVFD